jgi:hypothetical protein
VAGVEHLEAGVDAAQGRLAAGELDGAPGDVDTDGASVVERGEDGVLAGAAAGVLRARPARAGTITVALSMLASLTLFPALLDLIVAGASWSRFLIIARHLDGGRIETATVSELTDLGHSLDAPLAAMAAWGAQLADGRKWPVAVGTGYRETPTG